MKTKICPYCNEKVYYKESELSLIEDHGYGFFCILCGTFIPAHKKIEKPIINTTYSRRNSYSGYRYRNSYSQQRKRRRNMTAYAIVALLTIPIFIYFSQMLYPYATLPEQSESTFQIICKEIGYDMSDQIPISLSVPKDGVEFNSEIDLWTISNYYLLIDSQLPIDIKVDIRPFEYILVEINPNGIHPNYTTKIGIYPAGINYNFCFYAVYISNFTEVPNFSFLNKI